VQPARVGCEQSIDRSEETALGRIVDDMAYINLERPDTTPWATLTNVLLESACPRRVRPGSGRDDDARPADVRAYAEVGVAQTEVFVLEACECATPEPA
jgi:hypothetical protein